MRLNAADKGLCGGVNSFVAKQTRLLIRETEEAGQQVLLYGVGDKIRSALQRSFGDRFKRILTEVSRYPWNFTAACLISERLMQVHHSIPLLVCVSISAAIAHCRREKRVHCRSTENRSPFDCNHTSSTFVTLSLCKCFRNEDHGRL
ncbi:UNVERIFIED_CONTAM: hypothetical protein H355_013562 [Colinus virginianus]|nr:hypothetical protein H355_013562 [Colinus virginianus]